VVSVEVPGGTLRVELGDTIRLGGPVTHVFDVDLDLAGRPVGIEHA
jgi:diaminopimelate epimerase